MNFLPLLLWIFSIETGKEEEEQGQLKDESWTLHPKWQTKRIGRGVGKQTKSVAMEAFIVYLITPDNLLTLTL